MGSHNGPGDDGWEPGHPRPWREEELERKMATPAGFIIFGLYGAAWGAAIGCAAYYIPHSHEPDLETTLREHVINGALLGCACSVAALALGVIGSYINRKMR